MTHLDLFSGIGGFAYAVDQVWPGVEHIFCDNDPFAQQVLKKHWPEAKIYGDIRQLITDTKNLGKSGLGLQWQPNEEAAKPTSSRRKITTSNADSPRLEKARPEQQAAENRRENIDLLTGGFPCQPFSAAGVRRGTNDERYLWPAMLEVIQLTKPAWVIAENVYGILTWGEGVVAEQVCTGLESEGYEVQPFIIPAAVIGAPHRRGRVWFVANTRSKRSKGGHQTKRTQPQEWGGNPRHDWGQDWLKVATELCSVDDGLPVELDGFKLSKAAHRNAQIKAYGNAIVPQVAMEIMKAMVLL